MTSFISTLSLFVFVLANGYLTLPIIDEQVSSPTNVPIFQGFGAATTENTDLLNFTTESSAHYIPRSSFEQNEHEISLTTEQSPSQDAYRVQRMFNDSSAESSTFTAERSNVNIANQRPLLSDTYETYPPQNSFIPRSVAGNGLLHSSVYTTEEPMMIRHNQSAAASTRVQIHPEQNAFYPRSSIPGSESEDEADNKNEESAAENQQNRREESAAENEQNRREESADENEQNKREESADENEQNRREESADENEHNERAIQSELTTSSMLSFPSTSSVVSPHYYLPKSSASAKQYPGLLSADQESEGEGEERSTKANKGMRRVTKQPIDLSVEDVSLSSSTVSELYLEQGALIDVINIPVDFLNLEENNTLSVTDASATVRTSNKKYQTVSTPKPKRRLRTTPQPALNQGEEPSQSEEEKSNN